jgi:hypothetical protein
MKANTELFDTVKKKFPEVHTVGDCGNPRLIVDAVADGWRVGNEI